MRSHPDACTLLLALVAALGLACAACQTQLCPALVGGGGPVGTGVTVSNAESTAAIGVTNGSVGQTVAVGGMLGPDDRRRPVHGAGGAGGAGGTPAPDETSEPCPVAYLPPNPALVVSASASSSSSSGGFATSSSSTSVSSSTAVTTVGASSSTGLATSSTGF